MNSQNALAVMVFFTMTLGSFAADAPAKPAAPAGPKKIPPPGVAVTAADRAELEASLTQLDSAVDSLRNKFKDQPEQLELLPDVEIYAKSVAVALKYNEFMDSKEIPAAKTLLKHGLERAHQLSEGKAPWASATGLVPRAYVSKIDGSLQPYGMVVPPEFKPGDAPRRLDFWFHGRGETLTELSFMLQREKSAGEFTPAGTFVVHLYGRFCNANHFAGEIDLFETLERVKKQYPIDENRIAVRGFSMGGAACWHFAVHHAGLWVCAAPGAGFAETAEFSHIDPATVPGYEKTLWHMYDATDYAANLFNCPTVAYSGEIDKQKQAADIMAKAMAAEGLKLTHIIGPLTAHKYHPEAKKEVAKLVDGFAEAGRNPVPKEIRFTTWTLRYNQMKWITIDGMAKHWERALADGKIADNNTIELTTQNVTALTLAMPAKLCPLDKDRHPKVVIDGQSLDAPQPGADGSWTAHFSLAGKTWSAVENTDDGSLRKRHGLQGPIDDAFMDSFIMVRPTAKAQNEAAGAWTKSEFAKSTEHWRRIFRGDARVMDDSAIGDKEIASSNLVLWGDPSSNSILARIASKLPIVWDAAGIHINGKLYPADRHVLQLIYPNPLNPRRYIVINSGFTFMDQSSASNARHISMLPDWAVVDIAAPAESRVKDANFFGERWELIEK